MFYPKYAISSLHSMTELAPMDKELRGQRMWKAHEVINTGRKFSTIDVRLRCDIVGEEKGNLASFNRESPFMPS
jgi:hypothetical protein